MSDQTYYDSGDRVIQDSLHEELEKEREKIKSAFEDIKADLESEGITGLGDIYDSGDRPIQDSIHEELKREREKILEAFSTIQDEVQNAGVAIDSPLYDPDELEIEDSLHEVLEQERLSFETGFQSVDDKIEELINLVSTAYDTSSWSNLSHYWTFDDNTNPVDEVGALDFTVNGDPQAVNGIGGTNGVSFDGTDDLYFIDDATQLPAVEDLSYSVWFQVESGVMDQSEIFPFIVYNEELASPEHGFGVDPAGSAITGYFKNSNVQLSTPHTIEGGFAADTWHHLALTHTVADTSSELTFYFNGSQVSSTTGEAAPATFPSATSGGLWSGGWGPENHDILVDEPMVFEKELTSTDVSDLYNNPST